MIVLFLLALFLVANQLYLTLDEIYHVFVTLVYYLVENLFHF